MSELTPEQKKAYLDCAGSLCPWCESDDLIAGTQNIDCGSNVQKIHCGTCRREWWDTYTLTEITDA